MVTHPITSLVGLIWLAQLPFKQPQAWLHPAIDGRVTRTEWALAGSVFAPDQARPGLHAILYGYSGDRLCFALLHDPAPLQASIILSGPLGVQRVERIESGSFALVPTAPDSRQDALQAAEGRGVTEFAVTWQALGAHPGDRLRLFVQSAVTSFPSPALELCVPRAPAGERPTENQDPETHRPCP
ncbi:MAG: hypothetical protein VKP62_11810 [Candidatus Sericytochromatia bacterium]|nr:hypothetical protein [Candidatus Sericytochromatia bacterium]